MVRLLSMASVLMKENDLSLSDAVRDLRIRDTKMHSIQVSLPVIHSHCLVGETDLKNNSS